MMRHIYLLRHGQAEGSAPNGDAARALTQRGRDDVQRSVDALARMGVQPGRILHSPYTRARQTAEIASKALGCKALQEDALLVPNGVAPAAVDRVLEAKGTTLVVAHLPILPAIACELLRATVQIDLNTAGVLYLVHHGGPAAVLAGAWPPQTFL